MNIRYLLFKINLLRYIYYIYIILLYHVLPSLKKPHYSLFPKLLGFICKIFLEERFFFRFGAIYHEKNFFITGTNNWIEQDLGSTEGAIECPNQTVTTFFLCNICTEVLHCRNIVDLPILVIFLLWRF